MLFYPMCEPIKKNPPFFIRWEKGIRVLHVWTEHLFLPLTCRKKEGKNGFDRITCFERIIVLFFRNAIGKRSFFKLRNIQL